MNLLRLEKKELNMKFSLPIIFIIFFASSFFLMSCGSHFESSGKCFGSDCENEQNNEDKFDNEDEDKKDDNNTKNDKDKDKDKDKNWISDALRATINSGQFKGQKVIDYNPETDELLVYMPIPLIAGLENVKIDVPELPGTKIEIKSIEETTTTSNQVYIKRYLLTLSIPMEYVLNGVDSLPPDQLPDGQTLPGWPDGEAPSAHLFLFEKEDISLHLYLNKNAIGLFLEIPSIIDKNPLNLSISYPIYNEQQTKIVGHYNFIIPSKEQKGGLFLATQIPENVATALKNE